MDLVNTLRNVADEFWLTSGVKQVPETLIVAKCLSALLTYSGRLAFSKEQSKFSSAMGCINDLVQCIQQMPPILLIEPKRDYLSIAEVTKKVDEPIAILVSLSALKEFFWPLFLNDRKSTLLLHSTIVLLTFSMRNLETIPDINIQLLIQVIKDVDQLSPDLSISVMEFIETSMGFMNNSVIATNILLLFDNSIISQIRNTGNAKSLLTKHGYSTFIPKPRGKCLINGFFNNIPNHPHFQRYFIALLQMATTVSSAYHIGLPLVVLMLENNFNGSDFPHYAFDAMNLLQSCKRKVSAMIWRLSTNFSHFLGRYDPNLTSLSNQMLRILGIDTHYIDKEYMTDLIANSIYIPRMNLRHLTVSNYIIDSYILQKESYAFSLYASIQQELTDSSNGSICSIKVSNILGQKIILADEVFGEGNLCILLLIDEDKIKQIATANVSSERVLNLVNGEPAPYNYLYFVDPKMNGSYKPLEVALKAHQTLTPNTLTELWIGHYTPKEVLDIQKKFCISEGFNEITFQGAIDGPLELLAALEAGRLYGFDYSFKTQSDFVNRANIRFPLNNTYKTTVIYKEKGKLPAIPEDVKLTPRQAFAVASACFFPLTLVVGPPGTGKTMTFLAATKVLYYNMNTIGEYADSDERILICAHSNHALDQICLQLKADGFDILRLGRATEETGFLTPEGRIQEMVRHCPELDFICDENPEDVFEALNDSSIDWSRVDPKLASFLRSGKQAVIRSMIKNIGIVAATVAGTAFRVEFLQGAHIKTVLIEEAAQIVETEMLSILLLSPTRLIMFGDQHQLTPVIQSDLVRVHGRYSQSLFERFQKIGITAIQLTDQGRCIPAIADLFRDRYPETVNDLPSVNSLQPISIFAKPVQWIDITPKGDQPRTNLAEAEFIMALLEYLHSLDFDMKRVSVLTPYNAQKTVLLEMIEGRAYEPKGIYTIDQYQGLQNDVVVVSMVSRNPSLWFRDRRRITVLVSRARMALLFFGYRSGFENCPEWKEVMDKIRCVSPESSLQVQAGSFDKLSDFKSAIARMRLQ